MRVLLAGHAFAPGMGSEPGVTWNWAWHLSAHHHVTVLTHPQYRNRVDAYLEQHPNPNLTVHWTNLPAWMDPWKPEVSEKGLQVHYLLWQRQALKVARALHAKRPFDICHHVSWTTVSSAPALWRLPVPFVWGPLGGGITAPKAFLDYFGAAKRKEMLRTMRIRGLVRLPWIRRAAKASAVVLSTNDETTEFLKEAGARDVRFLPDFGAQPPSPPKAQRVASSYLEVLWAGRLEPRKALPLALEAMVAAGDAPIRLTVAGDGPLRQEWEQMAQRLGVASRVRFVGHVPPEKMPELFEQSDVFLFTSLRDASGTVVIEAMSRGVPVVTLDHQGMRRALPVGSALKVPVSEPKDTVAGLAAGLIRFLDAAERQKFAAVATEFILSQNWESRAETMSAWYDEIVTSRRSGVPAVAVQQDTRLESGKAYSHE